MFACGKRASASVLRWSAAFRCVNPIVLHDRRQKNTRIIMSKLIGRFLRQERGVTAIEYALIAGLIALAIVASLNNVKTSIVTVFTNIVTSLTP
jgi:pilus assembly protein Flp/PilA